MSPVNWIVAWVGDRSIQIAGRALLYTFIDLEMLNVKNDHPCILYNYGLRSLYENKSIKTSL